MTNNYYQKHKERLQNEIHVKDAKSFPKKKKAKCKESPRKNIKILMKI